MLKLSNNARNLIFDNDSYSVIHEGETKICYKSDYDEYYKIKDFYYLIIYKNIALTNVELTTSTNTISGIMKFISVQDSQKANIVNGTVDGGSDLIKTKAIQYFDNFIYNNGKLTLIDFERSMIGAIDYDFRILSRYKETPWLWANEKTDMLTVESDYQDLMDMFINNYEELRNIPYLLERLKVYEIIDLLNGYRKHREESQLKEVREKIKELLK